MDNLEAVSIADTQYEIDQIVWTEGDQKLRKKKKPFQFNTQHRPKFN